jgi:hypothetical protein
LLHTLWIAPRQRLLRLGCVHFPNYGTGRTFPSLLHPVFPRNEEVAASVERPPVEIQTERTLFRLVSWGNRCWSLGKRTFSHAAGSGEEDERVPVGTPLKGCGRKDTGAYLWLCATLATEECPPPTGLQRGSARAPQDNLTHPRRFPS